VTIDGPTVDAAHERASRAPLAPLPTGVRLADGAEALLERSLRTHRFLEAVGDLADLDAVALNCHSDVLRWGDTLGVVACLGSSMLWSAGVPVACTGDGATAVALMLGARIAGAAQYGEGYLVESATGELVVSSCGMADLSLAGDEAPRLCPNELYPGRHGMGIATRFDFAAGPATIAAYGPGTPSMPHRLVVSAGDLSGRGFEHLTGPCGTVGFDAPRAPGASAAWIDAAPAHHLALMRGDRRPELRAACRFLGVEYMEIGPHGRVA
jgi:L-arabinose isomerase